MIRTVKIFLALTVGLWGLLGGIGNLQDYEGGLRSVASVMSMETLPPEMVSGLATRNPTLVALGFAFIWGLKLLGGVLCGLGAVTMFRARRADADTFQAAKRWAIAGCAVLFFMLFFGFNFVAVGPYKLYASDLASAVHLAALFAAQVGIVMVFLGLRDR